MRSDLSHGSVTMIDIKDRARNRLTVRASSLRNKMLVVVIIKIIIIIIISEGNNYCDYFPTHSLERFEWTIALFFVMGLRVRRGGGFGTATIQAR